MKNTQDCRRKTLTTFIALWILTDDAWPQIAFFAKFEIEAERKVPTKIPNFFDLVRRIRVGPTGADELLEPLEKDFLVS
jgi:hypothetical protein